MQTIYEASILLVDDNPDLLVLVGDSLRTAGYTCIRTAATCAEAHIRESRFSCLRLPAPMVLS